MAGPPPGSGFHPHPPLFAHRFMGKLLGASMWFFIFYRARLDGPKLLGLSHPWEHHDSHEAHAEEH